MQGKFVVRFCDADLRVLAWATVYATPQPQGRPSSCPWRGPRQTPIIFTESGVVSRLLIHWTDCDLVREAPWGEPVTVAVGTTAVYTWVEPIWLVPPGGYQGALPAVTIGESVAVGVPAGGIGVVGLR